MRQKVRVDENAVRRDERLVGLEEHCAGRLWDLAHGVGGLVLFRGLDRAFELVFLEAGVALACRKVGVSEGELGECLGMGRVTDYALYGGEFAGAFCETHGGCVWCCEGWGWGRDIERFMGSFSELFWWSRARRRIVGPR